MTCICSARLTHPSGCGTEVPTGQERCDWCRRLHGHAKARPTDDDERALLRQIGEAFDRLAADAHALMRDLRAVAAIWRGEVDPTDPSSNEPKGEQHR